MLLMDERYGRETASHFDVPHLGLIGVLIDAKENRHIERSSRAWMPCSRRGFGSVISSTGVSCGMRGSFYSHLKHVIFGLESGRGHQATFYAPTEGRK